MADEIRHWPRISVITPSYNQGQFLGQCINSVLRQNYHALEFIIIDGGSTDESVAIIKENEARLTFWCSEPDGGQGAAINKGLRIATGDLVAWLNADDFYLPDALNRVARAYQTNPNASFYFGDGLRVDKSGRVLRKFFPEGLVVFNLPALVYGLNYILQPATFINRGKLTEVGYLEPTFHYGLDTDLWIRLAKHTPPSPVTALLAASREYPDTKTATGSFTRIEELRRIGEKYADIAMTPGTLCYFLDTLQRLARDRKDVFPASYEQSIATFWAATSNLLMNYGARSDGFPESGPEPRSDGTPVKPRKSAGAFLGRLIRKAGLGRETIES
jgi:glycosyltransferase involved in cell wall biosynthesis